MTGRAKSTLQVFCIGTADTKLAELLFLSRAIRSSLQSSSHASTPSFKVTVVDVSASTSYCGQASISPIQQQDIDISFVPAQDVLSAFFDGQTFAGLPDDRGEAIFIMSKALRHFLAKAFQQGVVAGAVGLGGSGGTSLIAPALRGSLPLGVPKLIVSTVASGNTQSYLETSDLILFPSLVDICGLNSVSRTVLSNAAAAVSGMVTAILSRTTCPPPTFDTERQRHIVGLTMFGVTTPCVTAVKDRLEKEGFETLVFHATGVGGRAMEDFVRDGFIQGVLDITTTEVADYVVGGVMACNSSRFDAIIEKKVPLVLSVGALDMVNFGAKHTIPSEFQSRNIHIHNEQVSLMRTTVDENKECARFIASKLDKSSSEICVCLPQEGVSALDAPGKPFFDPQATASLIDELDKLLEKNAQCQVKKFPYHINDPKFADVLVDTFIELNNKNFNHKRTLDGSSEQNQVHHSKDVAPVKTLSNYRSNPYTPFHYPDAKEETLQRTDKILQQLRAQIKNGKPIIGAGAGTGISAKFEEMGGVDLIVVYNSGRFRMAGRGSLAGLLPFADANAIVLEMANEVLPVVNDVPVLAGVCGTDPFRQMDRFIKQLEATGFVGVQNFPTVGLFDGNFRQNIEETGMGYSSEVEMIRKAHNLGLLTTPYAFNEDESIAMAEAGADIIVVHMGLTTSGSIGAKTTISLDDCVGRVQAIADAALGVNPGVIILCHGGPISGPKEAEFILKNTRGVHGFYGASSMERLPVEKAIANTMRQYKSISMK